MTPGMEEIHVLEETLNRVSSLTNTILSNVGTLQKVSTSTRKALAQSSTSNDGSQPPRENIGLLAERLAGLNAVIADLQKLGKIIQVSPTFEKFDMYLASVMQAQEISKKCLANPDLKQFVQVKEICKANYQHGVQNLLKLFRSMVLSVYEPEEGDQLIEKDLQLGEFDEEELLCVKKVLNGILQFKGAEDALNSQLGTAIELFINNTINFPPTSVDPSQFNKLLNNLEFVTTRSIDILFDLEPKRKVFQMFISELISSKKQATSKQAPPQTTSKQAPVAATAPLNPPSHRSSMADSNTSKPSPSPASSNPSIPNPAQPSAPQQRHSQPQKPAPKPDGWAIFDSMISGELDEATYNQYMVICTQLLKKLINDISAVCMKSPLTSEVSVSSASLQFMKFLKTVITYNRGVEKVLSEIPLRSYLPQPPPIWSNQPLSAMARASPLSLYFSDMADCFYGELHQIAQQQLNNQPKIGLYMLLQLATVEHFLTDSKDGYMPQQLSDDTKAVLGSVAIAKFQRLFEIALKDHISEWSKLAPLLIETTVTTNTNGKLTNKDREIVKDKFRKFNSEFEILVDKFAKLPNPDKSLKMRTVQEISRLLKPLYFRFYDKHSSGDFTKNVNKYVKYTKQQLEQQLQSI